MTEVIYDNAFSDDGYVVSQLRPISGSGQSYGKPVLKRTNPNGDVVAGIWKAEPGEYPHPGGEHGETFVVISGAAQFHMEGAAPITVTAGAVIEVPPNTPTAMHVTETLIKVAIIAPHT